MRSYNAVIERGRSGNSAMKTYRILFAGPGLSGRSTTITHLYDLCPAAARVTIRNISISMPQRRVIEASLQYTGAGVALSLLATPGSLYNSPLYEQVAAAADGIVFVIDSQFDRLEASAEEIRRNMDWVRQAGRDPSRIPCVIQYNKRDLPRIASIADLERDVNVMQWPYFESIATKGHGVVAPAEHVARALTGCGLIG